MSSLVKVLSKDFPELAKLSAGAPVKLTIIGRKGGTTIDGGQEMVELVVSSVETAKKGRMSPTQTMLAAIDAKTSRILDNVQQVNTPRP